MVMQRILIVITFLFVIFIQPSFAQVIQGGVQEDMHVSEITHRDGKIITPFFYKGQQNGYGIQYDNDLLHAYYYDMQGK